MSLKYSDCKQEPSRVNLSVSRLRKEHPHPEDFKMYPVDEIIVTEDMTAEEIKYYFHKLGFVCSKEFKGQYLLKMTALAKQRGQRIRV